MSKESHCKAQAKYRANNPEKVKALSLKSDKKYRENNKEKVKLSKQRWAEKNKDQVNHRKMLRRIRHKHSIPDWDLELTKFVFSEAKDLCTRRQNLFEFIWHVDHIIPLNGDNVCGLHVWNNLEVVPAKYNLQKGNRYYE